MKNLSPQILTRWISLSSALMLGIFMGFDQWFHGRNVDVIFIFLAVILCFFSVYGVARYLLERHIYSRLTPIYRIIQNQNKLDQDKLTGKEFSQDIIGNLDTEVNRWNAQTSKEIKMLKTLESYRKDYVGNVSHELKTPLFSIQGYIHTLLEGVDDKKIERKFLSRAASNTDRLLSIVNDLELITNIESGKIVLRKESFDLNVLIQDIMEDLEIQTDQKGITIRQNAGKDMLAFVDADREKIRQVIANLLVNSIKYGAEKGLIEVNLFDMDKLIMVEIRDNGPGIENEHLKHIFDRFYRIDKSRSRDIGGSGLGLSIVKHFVEAHGQSISVNSTVGKGTSFNFTLSKSKK